MTRDGPLPDNRLGRLCAKQDGSDHVIDAPVTNVPPTTVHAPLRREDRNDAKEEPASRHGDPGVHPARKYYGYSLAGNRHDRNRFFAVP